MHKVIAVTTSSVVPPIIATAQAAAIAAAVPTSAWQPPTAPATQAWFVTTLPTPAAAKNPLIYAWSSQLHTSPTACMTPGKIPQAPAVGHATMRNIFAFASFTEIA